MQRLFLTCCLTACFATWLHADELQVGATAANFTATGVDGKEDQLSKHLDNEKQNVVLIFSRANW